MLPVSYQFAAPAMPAAARPPHRALAPTLAFPSRTETKSRFGGLCPFDPAIVELATAGECGQLDDVEVRRQVEVARRDQRARLTVEDLGIGPMAEPVAQAMDGRVGGRVHGGQDREADV